MNDIAELRIILSAQLVTLGQLLAVEKQKTSALETGNIEGLDSIINNEQALVMESSAAEKQRIKMCKRLHVCNISELLEKFPESTAEIEPMHKDMLEIIKSIKKVSAFNMRLLDTRLKLVKFMTSQLGIPDGNVSYGKTRK